LRDWLLSFELRGICQTDMALLQDVIAPHGAGLWRQREGIFLHLPARRTVEALREVKPPSLPITELADFLDWFLSPPPLRWKLRSRELDLSTRTLIMGVVNVTPDSFSDGGQFLDPERAVEHGCHLAEAGADLLDIGGESTRPGAEPVPAEEEKRRILPVIEKLHGRVTVPLSVDTVKAEVARAALEAGAEIVNDISGFHFDPEMPAVVAEFRAGAVVMHIQGSPRDMQKAPHYRDVMEEILGYLAEGLTRGLAAGCQLEQLVVDPGIGFGKRWYDNYDIINRLLELSVLRRPVLIGASRKSFLGKILGVEAPQRLWGTLAAHTWAVLQGARVIRVHDVAEARQAAAVADAFVCRRQGVAPEELEEIFHG